MKYFFCFFCFFAFTASADDIDEYRYYSNDGSYMAYIKKNDNCVYGGSIKKGIMKQYCEMDKSGLNLKKDYPTIYATNLLLAFGRLSFIVAAPWGEQKCKINLHKNNISCEPTGK